MLAATTDRAQVTGAPLRVLSVIPGRPEGHNMVFARDANVALRRRGVDAQEFYLTSRTEPLRVLSQWRRLRRTIRAGNADIVHAQYGGVTGVLCALACGRRKFVLTVRGSDLNVVASMHPLRNRLTRWMTRWAARRADAIVCVSAALKEQLRSSGRKATVIPTGVDLELFRPLEAGGQASPTGGASTDEPLILFNAGQAPQQKGMALVEAAVDLRRSEGARLQLRITRGDLSREEMAGLMRGADCLVIASESEGSPNVVKEAMACGLPIVSVDVGDVALRLAGVEPSAIVERTPQAIANGIRDVLAAGGRSNGPEAIRRQRLSQQDSIDALQAVYVQLASHGGMPAPRP
jgi:glycosyltransferase involved in cell wall biosynthesis